MSLSLSPRDGWRDHGARRDGGGSDRPDGAEAGCPAPGANLFWAHPRYIGDPLLGRRTTHVDSLDHPHRHPRAGPARLLRPRPLLGLTSRRGGSAAPALPALRRPGATSSAVRAPPYEPALRRAGPRIEQRLVFGERFRHPTCVARLLDDHVPLSPLEDASRSLQRDLVPRCVHEPAWVPPDSAVLLAREEHDSGARPVGALADERYAVDSVEEAFRERGDPLVRRAERGVVPRDALLRL